MEAPNIPVKEDERLDRVNESILLLQKKDGLTFGTDAFLLASYVRPEPASCGVDLGSGTGILPLLLLARKKAAFLTAVEVQPSFAELIEKNATINGRQESIRVLPADLRELSAKDLGKEVDFVISNPPYLKANVGKMNRSDEKGIARHELSGDIFDFCAAADRLLKYGGRFYTVYHPERLADLMAALRENHLEPKRMTLVYPDEISKPCLVLTEAQKGAKSSLFITRPLFLYTLESRAGKARKLTKDAEAIYDTASFASFEK
ncbi:MAG: methyltransferase [Clostridia bacterium]|nr:methyltransferase [Clostridia bacterium]